MMSNTIITKNNKMLYRLPKPKKYPYLSKLFQDDIRKEYVSIMHYIKAKNTYHPTPFEGEGNKLLFHLSSYEFVRLRGKGTYGTANRHINFLCAMGLIRKYKQRENTKINHNFKKNKPYFFKGMNTFYILSFDPNGERLAEIEARCRKLSQHGVTKGNIKKDKLIGEGLADLAEEIYFDTHSGIANKEKRYLGICNFLDSIIETQGFATKQKIYDHFSSEIRKSKIDIALKQFKDEFHANYNYKKPTKAQKERFCLVNDTWIITKK